MQPRCPNCGEILDYMDIRPNCGHCDYEEEEMDFWEY